MSDDKNMTKLIVQGTSDTVEHFFTKRQIFFCSHCGIRMIYFEEKSEVFCPRCNTVFTVIEKLQDINEKSRLSRCNTCKRTIPLAKLLFRDRKKGRPRWFGVCETCKEIVVFCAEMYFCGFSARRTEAACASKYGVSPHFNVILRLVKDKDFLTNINWDRVDALKRENARTLDRLTVEYRETQRRKRYEHLAAQGALPNIRSEALRTHARGAAPTRRRS